MTLRGDTWKDSSDLAGIRAHADTDAAALAKNLRAQGLTIGWDIYFAQGKFDPASSKGQALLGHEITHVLQQRGRRPRRQASTGSVDATGASLTERRDAHQPRGGRSRA